MFPGTFKALCLLLLSEQMRYPPSANLSQVQTLFQNCLHTAFWYASTTSYIFDRQSRILFDHNLYSSDVSLGNRYFRPSRMGIIFNRKFPSFKSFNPPKNCAHWNGLSSDFYTNLPLWVLGLAGSRIPASQTQTMHPAWNSWWNILLHPILFNLNKLKADIFVCCFDSTLTVIIIQIFVN